MIEIHKSWNQQSVLQEKLCFNRWGNDFIVNTVAKLLCPIKNWYWFQVQYLNSFKSLSINYILEYKFKDMLFHRGWIFNHNKKIDKVCLLSKNISINPRDIHSHWNQNPNDILAIKDSLHQLRIQLQSHKWSYYNHWKIWYTWKNG